MAIYGIEDQKEYAGKQLLGNRRKRGLLPSCFVCGFLTGLWLTTVELHAGLNGPLVLIHALIGLLFLLLILSQQATARYMSPDHF